jgi:hypothetical protein
VSGILKSGEHFTDYSTKGKGIMKNKFIFLPACGVYIWRDLQGRREDLRE